MTLDTCTIRRRLCSEAEGSAIGAGGIGAASSLTPPSAGVATPPVAKPQDGSQPQDGSASQPQEGAQQLFFRW
jgi:hypothetical protein